MSLADGLSPFSNKQSPKSNYFSVSVFLWITLIQLDRQVWKIHMRQRESALATLNAGHMCISMGFLPDTRKCGLRMRRECRERFPRHRLQRKPLISDPGMHHGTCVTHVPWCMSGSPTCDGGGKRSRHSRHMRNPQFYLSGKRPMLL